jgi:hypothetical protein
VELHKTRVDPPKLLQVDNVQTARDYLNSWPDCYVSGSRNDPSVLCDLLGIIGLKRLGQTQEGLTRGSIEGKVVDDGGIRYM